MNDTIIARRNRTPIKSVRTFKDINIFVEQGHWLLLALSEWSPENLFLPCVRRDPAPEDKHPVREPV